MTDTTAPETPEAQTEIDPDVLHGVLHNAARTLLNQAATQWVETHAVGLEDALYHIAHQALMKVFMLVNMLPGHLQEMVGQNPIITIPPAPEAPTTEAVAETETTPAAE